MVCLRNICINTLHKGDNDDDDGDIDDDDDDKQMDDPSCSAVPRLLGLRVISLGVWLDVCCECCVSSR